MVVPVTRGALALALIAIAGCGATGSTDAAPRDAGTDAPLDAALREDSSVVDAAPVYQDLLCTGGPIPDGLSCIVQDVGRVGPCDGRGGVVFDGFQCRVARGPECSAAGRGVFDSLEECGVTCAAAGYCVGAALRVVPEEGGRFPNGCQDAPAECINMWLDANRLPAACDVWGPFTPPSTSVTSGELPYPEQWDVLWSFTLVADFVDYVNCGQAL